MKKAWVLSYPMSAQRRLWSDWADARTDLGIRWAQSFCWFCHKAAHLYPLRFVSIEVDPVQRSYGNKHQTIKPLGPLLFQVSAHTGLYPSSNQGILSTSFHISLYMSRDMTKPTKCVRPEKIQISLGIHQSDQSLRCWHEETLGP